MRMNLRFLGGLLTACLATVLLGCGKSNETANESRPGKAEVKPIASKPGTASTVGVPVGGVILWWGSKSDIPPGFEICDGQAPTTEGAVLKGKKPDLTDRFVKGPQEGDADIADLGAGGTDTLDLHHTHGSSNLVALIGVHDQPQFMSYKARGRGFTGANWQIRAESAGRPSGGPSSATAVSGETDPALAEKIDNRPAFQEMFFLIRVR